MAYENPLMDEFMIPRNPSVAERLHGFYEDIGWDVRNSTGSEFFIYVSPQVSEGPPPTPAYWQTENERKIARFVFNESFEPTPYAHGLILPQLEDLVEVCLIVPSDEDVHTIFERGGSTLERHTHTPLQDHAGAQEFRFSDPFNYSLRVTANPGWEVSMAGDGHEKLAKASSELEPYDGPLLNLADFTAVAEMHDIGKQNATRAWNGLIRMYDKHKNPDYNSKFPWYREENYSHIASLVFEKSPDRVIGLGSEYWDGIGDLRLDGLEELVTLAEAVAKRRGDYRIATIIGDNSGRKTLDLLKLVIEHFKDPNPVS